MLKNQSNTISVPAAKLLPDSDRIAEIATQTGLVKRDSKKFCSLAFLLVCIKASISSSGTLEQLASALAKTTRRAMSRSGMYQRFHSETLAFFVSALYETLWKRFCVGAEFNNQEHFRGVIIEDSTFYKMNAKNFEEFPAHGNGACNTAGCKVDFTFDLLNNEVLEASLHLATQQDKEIGKQTLAYVRPQKEKG